MLYLTCTMISKVDLARNGVSHAKDWVFVDCGTRKIKPELSSQLHLKCCFPAYMDMNAVQKTPAVGSLSAGSQPGSREPASATPPFKQAPLVKQVKVNKIRSHSSK